MEPYLQHSIIMDIFYQSDFYEKESSNEVLRSQLIPVTAENLAPLRGIEFVVVKSSPDKSMFWIEKRNRISDNLFEVVSVYYFSDFVIYQAPTLAGMIDTKLNNAIFYTKQAFEILTPSLEEKIEQRDINLDYIFHQASD